MKRKKLLAVILSIAMLASLSIPAFATDPDPAPQAETPAVTYSYSDTSDPITITNFSNMDVKVALAVKVNGMDGATFVDNADCKDGAGDDAEVIPDSLYLGLIVDEDAPIAIDENGEASTEKVVSKAADGAYIWKVKDKSDNSGKEYVYELQDELEDNTDAEEFSAISFKMTGAVSSEGWSSFSGNPSYTVTWTCSSTAEPEEEAEEARVAYTDGTDTVYWDKTEQKFYDAATDGAESSSYAISDADTDVGADGLPTAQFLSDNSLTAVESEDEDETPTDDRFSSFNGSSENQVTFEGSAPPEIVDLDVPTSAADVFEFILDPNGLIEATEAEMYDGATFDFENSKGMFFKNVAGAGEGGGNGGNNASTYTGAKATIVTPAAVLNDIVTITIDYGDSGMTTVSKFQCKNQTGGNLNVTPSATNANYKLVSNTQLEVKAIAANFNGSAGEYKLVLTNADGSETLTLPIDIKTAGVYTLENAGD